MNPSYPLVAARARHACEYCRAPEIVFNLPFEVEHITPQSRGGKTTEDNLALSCRSCNLYKSDFIVPNAIVETMHFSARLSVAAHSAEI